VTPAGYLAALLLGLGVHTASSAGFAEGAAAYGRHDDARALRELAPLAAHGNPQAEHVLGLMYYTGRGVARDDAQAFGWLHKAAVQGVPAAQYVVGAMFYLGLLLYEMLAGIHPVASSNMKLFEILTEVAQRDAPHLFVRGVLHTQLYPADSRAAGRLHLL